MKQYKVTKDDKFKIHEKIIKSLNKYGMTIGEFEMKGDTRAWYKINKNDLTNNLSLTLIVEYDSGYVCDAFLCYQSKGEGIYESCNSENLLSKDRDKILEIFLQSNKLKF